MKIFLFFFLFIPFLSFAQNEKQINKFINELIMEKIIKPEHQDKIKKDSVVESIYDIYLNIYGLQRGQRRRAYFTSPAYEKKAELLIELLNKYKIIDKETYKDLNNKYKSKSELESEKVHDIIDILQYLYDRKVYEKTKKGNTIKKYLSKLNKIGLIKDISRINYKKIQTQKDIYFQLTNSLSIESKNLPNSVEATYKYTLSQFEKLTPLLRITDFNFKIIDREYKGSKYKSAVISFKCNGKNYITENSYKKEQEEFNNVFKISYEFLNELNIVLTENESNYRLFFTGRQIHKEFVTFLFVDKKQFDFLKEEYQVRNFTYFDSLWYKVTVPEFSNPFDLLTPNKLKMYFSTFDSLGLFVHLSEKTKQEKLADILKLRTTTPESIFYEVEGLILGLDWEMSFHDKPYEIVTKNFAKYTRGDFNPTDIKDDFSIENLKTVNYSFSFKGKKYESRLPKMGDWYADDFLKLINKAISENNLPGKYYKLPNSGQVSVHIYLTPSQYEYLEKYKILEFQ